MEKLRYEYKQLENQVRTFSPAVQEMREDMRESVEDVLNQAEESLFNE